MVKATLKIDNEENIHTTVGVTIQSDDTDTVLDFLLEYITMIKKTEQKTYPKAE